MRSTGDVSWASASAVCLDLFSLQGCLLPNGDCFPHCEIPRSSSRPAAGLRAGRSPAVWGGEAMIHLCVSTVPGLGVHGWPAGLVPALKELQPAGPGGAAQAFLAPPLRKQ